MSLVDLRTVLADAMRNSYAVGSFNIAVLDMVRPILEAAEEASSPVIINVGEAHLKYVDLEDAACLVRQAARRVRVPVVLHLDHGFTYSTIVKAIRSGFTSVMFDGSILSYEDNVAQTAEIVKMAHAAGVSVEAELGHVGGGEATSEPSEADPSLFTDPGQACHYVEQTGIDALAVAIGSVHGPYKGEPKLDFDRLGAIRGQVQAPLVLHGGSGISDSDFQKAIKTGISKINFATNVFSAAVDAVREVVTEERITGFPNVMERAKAAIKAEVAERMRVFGSAGRV